MIILDISSTQVSDIRPLKDLTRLMRLNISNTLVKDISPLEALIRQERTVVNWSTMDGSITINLENCPLSNPPVDIVKKGRAAILDYWDKNRTK